ncbi:hypothetical protein KPL78_29830 [Roseomonas sp. HJA6]|uniref:Tail assembly chaperone n=1 Tax=Roseomonas alba TaxID=2846776 RepID=A0ABS7AID8_9PROT|nr:hypothetical protein [Neoroseomonas alba]MBW6402084.1 hypothetical protein [Neoroseomonas alba]
MADTKPEDLVDLDAGDAGVTPGSDLVDLDAAEEEGKLPPQAKLQEDGSILFTLRHPVTIRYRKGGSERSETIETLHMRRLQGKDMRRATQAGGAATIAAAAASAGWEGPKFDILFDRMDADDAMAVLEVAAHFISSGRRIGR